jgi:hypothetical protein
VPCRDFTLLDFAIPLLRVATPSPDNTTLRCAPTLRRNAMPLRNDARPYLRPTQLRRYPAGHNVTPLLHTLRDTALPFTAPCSAMPFAEPSATIPPRGTTKLRLCFGLPCRADTGHNGATPCRRIALLYLTLTLRCGT